MITVEEALKTVLENKVDYGSEEISFEKAQNRVLDEEIKADRDFPPYNRVTMDGIAICYAHYEQGNREFTVEATAYAGSPQVTLADTSHAVEVMTGAMLPVGCDTVIRYEDIKMEDGKATISIEDLVHGLNIHFQGLDRKSGDVILTPGTVIGPKETAVINSVGKVKVRVKKMPTICVVATGDELVTPSETPEAHQIRSSNLETLQAAILKEGVFADTALIKDEPEKIKSRLKELLDAYDVIILTGGVSKGKKDYVPEALEEAGVKKLFHRVTQRPGKPFWFGKSEKNRVFALPGNPVSTFMCYNKYFRTWLYASLGLKPTVFKAALKEDFEFLPDLTYFLQVKLESGEDGTLYGIPVPGKGSGDFANLVDTDAFLELTRGKDLYTAGETFDLIGY